MSEQLSISATFSVLAMAAFALFAAPASATPPSMTGTPAAAAAPVISVSSPQP